ncbi:MAG: Rieske 2Fe-2S domain-containing protein [Deltaproteobacteria bacterium]|nr:Rieske 2Fe-2S domain-containing protein [Deltaproteobacteria bacterium]MBW2496286.1 Rieske 2Fe-2S domain-containing protein [Deltaproteobacteria bacterium]
MLSPEDNERLTRIEGDAPMGVLMREHCWIPALLSIELVADGAPKRARLLGRDYVAFRDTRGEIGFLDEGCPHRNASLVLARNEECGLRCIFHGWKIDTTGQVVEAATHHPNPEAFASRIKMKRYPTVDAGGIVWVWLGEREAPPFPHLPFTRLPASRTWVTVTECACNWLQGVEATLDTAHIGTLHKAYIEAYSGDSGAQISRSLDSLAPEYKIAHADYGLDAIGIRPMADGTSYVRTTRWLMPFVSLVPGSPGNARGDVDGVIFIVSPVDDTHHRLLFGFWSNGRDINDGRYESIPEAQRSLVGDRPFDVFNFGGFAGGRDENWGQDREAMAKGHFSGFTGNLLQEDTVTQLSMGPIVDRSREHLSSSDVAVVQARRALLRGLDNVAAGRWPVGEGPAEDHTEVVPTDVVLDSSPSEVSDSAA